MSVDPVLLWLCGGELWLYGCRCKMRLQTNGDVEVQVGDITQRLPQKDAIILAQKISQECKIDVDGQRNAP